MSACACVYDEYEIRTEVCRPCAAGLEQRTRDWHQARSFLSGGASVVVVVWFRQDRDAGILLFRLPALTTFAKSKIPSLLDSNTPHGLGRLAGESSGEGILLFGSAMMNRPVPEERHGRLAFIRMLPPDGRGRHRSGLWRCDCGTEKALNNSRVVCGRVRSCGCLCVDASREANTHHGLHGTPTYQSWISMNRRCHVPSDKDYPRYGAKGITVCPEWRTSFAAFLKDVGHRPAGTSIDRYPNNRGNYEPGNVRWATPKEQQRNRTNFILINTPTGVEPLIDYAQRIGISRGAAFLRLRRGKLEGCSRV